LTDDDDGYAIYINTDEHHIFVYFVYLFNKNTVFVCVFVHFCNSFKLYKMKKQVKDKNRTIPYHTHRLKLYLNNNPTIYQYIFFSFYSLT